MIATCHCRAVNITLSAKPDFLNDCNCTLCSKVGALWGYFDPAVVTVSGDTAHYVRSDYIAPAVSVHFCGNCGSCTCLYE